jgi:hypothetical protein
MHSTHIASPRDIIPTCRDICLRSIPNPDHVSDVEPEYAIADVIACESVMIIMIRGSLSSGPADRTTQVHASMNVTTS